MMVHMRRRGIRRLGRDVFVALWCMVLSEWARLPTAAASDAIAVLSPWVHDQEGVAAASADVRGGGLQREGEAVSEGWRSRDRRRGSPEDSHNTGQQHQQPPALVDEGGEASRRRRRPPPRRQREQRRLEEQHSEENAEPDTDDEPIWDAEQYERLSRAYKRLSADRDYLNGLVDNSAKSTGEQVCNVAFAKTHKTASTTMAMILVRYARRHEKRLASFGGNHVSEIPLHEAVDQIKESGERVDVMHYHYTVSGNFQGRWAQATAMYEKIMQEGERINYITVVRSPRSHFMSYYYYYVQPEVQLSVQHFFESKRKDDGFKYQRKRLSNPLCSEFGIHNREQLAHFIEVELPDFRLVFLTEKFDEGLMIMRRLMGWDMIDMTYSRMMETKAGARRWDGKQLKNVPHWDDLPDWVQEKVDYNTALDRILYDAAVKHYNEMKAVASIEIEEDLRQFGELQRVVNRYLHGNTSSEAAHWYSGRAEPYLGGEPFHQF